MSEAIMYCEIMDFTSKRFGFNEEKKRDIKTRKNYGMIQFFYFAGYTGNRIKRKTGHCY